MPMIALNDHYRFAEQLLPNDKFIRYKQLTQLPIETVESTESIFDELSKVFTAEDRIIKVDFVDDKFAQDYAEFVQKTGFAQDFDEVALDAMKTGINDFLVVDLPKTQSTPRPEPYYVQLSIWSVRDVDIADKGTVEYLTYKQGHNRMIVIDDDYYRVFERVDNATDFALIEGGEVAHGLGYCPACSFWAVPIKGSKGVNKKGPITKSLSKLDWLLFWRTSKKYFDMYGSWPIIVSYDQKCNYRDQWGNQCEYGYISITNGPSTQAEDYVVKVEKCPHCSAKNFMGPGTVLTVPAPADNEQFDQMSNPIKVIEIPTAQLEWCVKELQRLEDEVFLNCVGWDGESLANKAVNENQVAANFESKDNVIMKTQRPIEVSYKFILETACRLRYDENFIRAIVSFGTEHYLKSEAIITAEYKDAVAAGLPMYYTTQIREQLNRTRNKNNPDQLQRSQILAQLEPYPDLTIMQMAAAQIPTIDPVGYTIKINFTTFIQRFERENTNIVAFGGMINPAQKINIIQQKLNDYAKEKNPKPQLEPPGNEGA